MRVLLQLTAVQNELDGACGGASGGAVEDVQLPKLSDSFGPIGLLPAAQILGRCAAAGNRAFSASKTRAWV